MITVLIAAGAGLGGILIGFVADKFGLIIGERCFHLSGSHAHPLKDSGAVQKRATPTVLPRMGSRDASADYAPRMDSFDVAPAIPYPHPVSAEHPPTDIDD